MALQDPKRTRTQADDLFIEVDRVLREEEKYSVGEAMILCEELRRVLVCKARTEGDDLGVPVKIDRAWHLAVLNTKEYRSYCFLHFNKVIQHSTNTDKATLPARIQKTKEIYLKLFKVNPRSFAWSDEEPTNPSSKEEPFIIPSVKKEEKALIYVRTLTGTTMPFTVTLSITVLQLMQWISSFHNYTVGSQRLIFEGKQLEEHRTLESCGIKNESTIDLVLRMSGC